MPTHKHLTDAAGQSCLQAVLFILCVQTERGHAVNACAVNVDNLARDLVASATQLSF